MKTNNVVGAWSMIGTYALVLLLAMMLLPFNQAITPLIEFFFGNALSIHTHSGLVNKLPDIFWIVVIELPIAMLIGLVVLLFLGKAKNALELLAGNRKPQNLFRTLFVLVVLEELFARWLFLGVLTKIPGLDNSFGFYFLMFLGNTIWAWMHLNNYKEKKDKQAPRVFPQFVSGIFLSYIYVRHGLTAAVLTHFLSNGILFVVDHVQKTNWIDILHILVPGFYVIAGYLMLTKPLVEMKPWLENGNFKLAGWGFWDYFFAAMLITGSAKLIINVLLYDKNKPKSDPRFSGWNRLWIVPMGSCMILGAVYFLFWVLGFAIQETALKILVLSILVLFITENNSCSAAYRVLWENVPGFYVFVCITFALGFWGALAFVIVDSIVDIPMLVVAKLDD